MAMSWFVACLDKGEEPPDTFHLEIEVDFETLVVKWPDYKVGQKLFLFSFSIFIATVGVAAAWLGAMAADWTSILFNGSPPLADALSQPLGDWLTLWLTQIGAIVIFYSLIEFWTKRG